MSKSLDSLRGVLNSVPRSELDNPASPYFLNAEARRHLKPNAAKTAAKTAPRGSLFKGRSELKQRVESIEQAQGIEIGSTAAKLRKRAGKTGNFVSRFDYIEALRELETVAAAAKARPTAANLRRAELASRSATATLAKHRAQAREAAKAAKPETPHLAAFDALSGSQASAYFREHRSAIRGEQDSLAAWEARQSKA